MSTRSQGHFWPLTKASHMLSCAFITLDVLEIDEEFGMLKAFVTQRSKQESTIIVPLKPQALV